MERDVIIPLTLFIKKVLLGKCTGISFVASTPLRVCKNIFQRLFVDGIQFITKPKSNMKGALMSVSDRLLLRKRAIIEAVNDKLKNIAQVEHSRHRCFDNFIVNLLGAIAAYCLFPKKPCINVQRTIDTQLALFWIRRTHVIYYFWFLGFPSVMTSSFDMLFDVRFTLSCSFPIRRLTFMPKLR